jgi:phosphoribosylanthranilate isomerase
MSLKTNVWVNKITTLSEARYCAGMGVQFLGFQPAVVDVKTYRDITGWVSGPSFFLDISEEMTMPAQVADYACEYLLIREEQVNELPATIDSKLLIKKSLSYSGSTPSPTRADSILLFENWAPEWLEKAPARTVVAVSNPAEALLAISLPIAGILLQGSTEASPGLMEYDHLSSVLELLETED